MTTRHLGLIIVLASLAGCDAMHGSIGIGGGSGGGFYSGAGLSAPIGRESDPQPADATWKRSPIGRRHFFPIAVWTQDPALAPQYKELGINTYFGLWQGPTEEQLATLRQNGMYVICAQNEVGLAHRDDPTIIAWMHGDEPDNRQKDYADGPIPLDKLLADYREMKSSDATRPIIVNFGQGVANDLFPGRALKLDDYPAYARAADIVSYDVYPVANIKLPREDGQSGINFHPQGGELLWYVARGVNRLEHWTDYRKPVWNVIECTHISNPAAKATPHQVRAEVWMSIINGSRGITWFVHQFEPVRNVQMLLADEEMKAAVKAINTEVTELAPVINSPDIHNGSTVETENYEAPIDWVLKQYDGETYLLAVAMRNAPTRGLFRIKGLPEKAVATVIGEGRTFDVTGGTFTDTFAPHAVRLYRITRK